MKNKSFKIYILIVVLTNLYCTSLFAQTDAIEDSYKNIYIKVESAIEKAISRF